MTDPPDAGRQEVEHHRPVEYSIQDFSDRVTGWSVRPGDDRQTFTVAGVCPGCGGRTETVWMFGSGNGHKGIFGRRAATTEPADRRRTVCCDCGHAHANRPADAAFLGCGAHWRVEFS